MKPVTRNSRRIIGILVILMIVVVCAFSIRGVVAQKNARHWVEEQGHVMFSFKYDKETRTWNHRAQPAAPAFLVDWLGIDWFASVDSVILDNQTVEELRPITGLSNLRRLGIYIEISDDLDFSPLAELRHLEELHLMYTEINDERFGKLRELLPDVAVTADNH